MRWTLGKQPTVLGVQTGWTPRPLRAGRQPKQFDYCRHSRRQLSGTHAGTHLRWHRKGPSGAGVLSLAAASIDDTSGKIGNDAKQVVAGATAGDTVVLQPPAELKDGGKVKDAAAKSE